MNLTRQISQLPPGVPIGDIEGIGGYVPAIGESGAVQAASLVSNIVGFLTMIGGLMFLIYFILGGLNWITAGGDPGKVDEAKKKTTGAAIGMIIVVVAYAIALIVGQVLGIDILNPVSQIDLLNPSR